MTKYQVIKYLNNDFGFDKFSNKNTTFASISISGIRAAWWMNIKLENFKKDWNIVLVGDNELLWLKIPANTYIKPEEYFRIWESKNAADLLISSDPRDRYLQDISSGCSGVDFKSLIVEKFSIPEELKVKASEAAKRVNRSKAKETNAIEKTEFKLKQGQRILKENEKNVSYQSLFADYLEGSIKIVIQDPYIRYPHQFKNLQEFCLMIGNNKKSEEEINLVIVTWNSEEFHRLSKIYFDEVVASVSDLRINLSYRFEEHHDRYIEADNGWKIVLGRGLDIFQKPEGRFSIGDIDQSRRKCRACEITYLKE